MAVPAAWWKRNRNSSGFPQTADLVNSHSYPLDLGASPMGDSQFDCGSALEVKVLRQCRPDMLKKFKNLSLASEIVDESGVTTLMDEAIYVARSEDNGVSPCRRWPKDAGPAHLNRFHVVFDAQYSNQPACCSPKDLPTRDSAHEFQHSEAHVSTGDNVSSSRTGDIRFGKHGRVVYSFLEPVR